jgi:hypothetical protein
VERKPPAQTRSGDQVGALRIGSVPLSGTLGEDMSQIRLPRLNELERLRAIERDAGRAFTDIGMHEIAEHEPLSVVELKQFVTAGRAWVATNSDDVPVAYLMSSVVDASAHVEQVSVMGSARSECDRGSGSPAVGDVDDVPRCAVECRVLRASRI